MTNTALSATDVAKLSALILGGTYKRSASKADAVMKFQRTAAIKGLSEETIAATLDAANIDTATDFLRTALNAIDLPAAPEAAPTFVVANAETEEALREVFAPAPALTPGLRRLQAAADAGALAAQANDEAARALADAAKRRAALEAAGPAPEARAKPAKAPKAPKVQKAKAAKETASRERLDPAAIIATVAANPKKAGSRSFAVFALYQAGQTVQAFIDAVVAAGYPASEAKSNLSWDRRKGFVTVKAAA